MCYKAPCLHACSCSLQVSKFSGTFVCPEIVQRDWLTPLLFFFFFFFKPEKPARFAKQSTTIGRDSETCLEYSSSYHALISMSAHHVDRHICTNIIPGQGRLIRRGAFFLLSFDAFLATFNSRVHIFFFLKKKSRRLASGPAPSFQYRRAARPPSSPRRSRECPILENLTASASTGRQSCAR